jgi:O-succinylbenzoate synthase
MMVDANGDYTLDHIDVFRRLDEFNLMMIEQPLAGPMLEESARVAKPVAHSYLPG